MKILREYLANLSKILQDLKQDTSKVVTVVLGNESCDLDSAICSLVYAHHLNSNETAIPMLNIPLEDVPLRTEVKFCLKENLGKIPTRDDLNLTTLSNLKLVLVDHHVLQTQDLSLLPRIVEIIDHREQSPLAKFPPDCQITRELVGSCSSLIADKVLNENYQDDFGLELLRATIITDTVNFSSHAKKATALDISITEKIEKMLPNLLPSRKTVFSDISNAKRDIQGFTTEQLFRKDLKIVPLPNETQAAVPSTLLLADEICKKFEDVEELEAIFDKFCQRYNSQLLIIIGHNHGKRDILFYYPEEHKNCSELVNDMKKSLLEHAEINAKVFKELSSRCLLIKQGNVTFTRKKILPILLNSGSND